VYFPIPTPTPAKSGTKFKRRETSKKMLVEKKVPKSRKNVQQTFLVPYYDIRPFGVA
jgi:hypothetical protein